MLIFLTGLWMSGCTGKAERNDALLVLGTHAAYPPYESVNAKGEIVGFDIDVAKAVAKKLGKELVVKNMSFDALILSLKQNKFDMIMAGISITPSREREIAMVAYQGDVVKSLTLLFWNKIPANIVSVSDLSLIGNKTVAVQTGTTMESYLNNIKGVDSKALEGTIELIMDIKHGKSVAALVEPHIANAITAKHPQIKRIDFVLPKEDWVLGNGIGIAKGNIKFAVQIQDAIQSLKDEGVIKNLESKWLKAEKS